MTDTATPTGQDTHNSWRTQGVKSQPRFKWIKTLNVLENRLGACISDSSSNRAVFFGYNPIINVSGGLISSGVECPITHSGGITPSLCSSLQSQGLYWIFISSATCQNIFPTTVPDSSRPRCSKHSGRRLQKLQTPIESWMKLLSPESRPFVSRTASTSQFPMGPLSGTGRGLVWF